MAYRAHVIISGEPQQAQPVTAALLDEIGLLGLGNEVEVLAATDLTVQPSSIEAIVYPDGVHYGNLTPDSVRLVATEHLLKGRPVQDLVMRAQVIEPLDEPSTKEVRVVRCAMWESSTPRASRTISLRMGMLPWARPSPR